MKKYIFLGIIIVVTVLIGVSFTSVVGFRNIESNVKISPLFNIRTSRTMNQEIKDFSCEYVGKGKNNNIILPVIHKELSLIYHAIENINKIDEDLIRLNIHQLNKLNYNNLINKEDLQRTINNLYQIVKNNEDILNDFKDGYNTPLITPITIYGPIYLLIILFFVAIFGLYVPIMSIYAGVTCDPCCIIYDPYTFRT